MGKFGTTTAYWVTTCTNVYLKILALVTRIPGLLYTKIEEENPEIQSRGDVSRKKNPFNEYYK